MEMSVRRARFYGIRVTLGQEVTMALLIEERVKANKLPVYSLAVLPGLRGVIVAEADVSYAVQRAATGLKHVRGLMRGSMEFSEVEKFVAPKPMIEMVRINDLVEITGGPFVGMKGRVVEIDKSKGEVKVEITEAAYPLPITISAEYLRILSRQKEEGGGGR
ncbi:MAG: transcription elongation factor Spt5 [Thermoprotei archaeon]|nr:MAG: transcription elongation factor Spt5 [Thermoprotei archaeon]RLE96798.1 MAG: transcription elongation factor Spt5 [Thermoprotei archaeon]